MADISWILFDASMFIGVLLKGDPRNAVSEIGNTKLAYPYLMAVSSIITLPIFLAFFFAQRTFIEGISLTGLKG